MLAGFASAPRRPGLRALARRLALACIAAAALGGSAPHAGGQQLSPDSPGAEFGVANVIVRENRLGGSAEWRRPTTATTSGSAGTFDRPDDAGDSAPGGVPDWEAASISGYADRTSVEPGGVIRFYVSTTAPRFDLNVSRMGWYGGEGGRVVYKAYGLPGSDQLGAAEALVPTAEPPPELALDEPPLTEPDDEPDEVLLARLGAVGPPRQQLPTPDPETGLVAANWRPTYSLTIPRDWVSGVYLVRLVANDANLDSGYIVFVVRDDQQLADFVYKVAVNTYQAYNNWGGKSLYPQNSVGKPASKVSFDRPYSQWDGAGHFFDWDFPMIRWLEREGYNVTYITDVDAHADAGYLAGRRALLSVGHDEYWSKEMRDRWEAARDAKLSLAFFSGNTAYWQVRYEPSAAGVANRVLVGYKNSALDPFTNRDNSRVTSAWRSDIVGRPENGLLGVQWESVLPFGKGYPYVVKDADHWIFAGTAAKPGQAWSAIVGYEYDRVYDNGQTPRDLVVLSESPVEDINGKSSVSHSSYYRQGGMVFAAGTVNWAWALDDWRLPGLVDARLQRTTANVLRAFRQGGPPVLAEPPPASPFPIPWLVGGSVVALGLVAAGVVWYARRPRAPVYDPWAE